MALGAQGLDPCALLVRGAPAVGAGGVEDLRSWRLAGHEFQEEPLSEAPPAS